MGDAEIIERIAAWQAAGLIDAAVAAQLRAAEADRPVDAGRHNPITAAAAFFGPAVTIAEMFGYIGTAFVLAAWYTLVGRIADGSADRDLIWAFGHGLVAVTFVLLGVGLLRGSARARRAAGAAFLVAVGATIGSLETAGAAVTNLGPDPLRVGAATGGLLAVVVFRRIHPALLTQLGLLGGITTLAWSIQQWVEHARRPALPNPGQFLRPAKIATTCWTSWTSCPSGRSSM